MTRLITRQLLVVSTVTAAFAVTSAQAQVRVPSDPDPTRVAAAPEEATPSNWQIRVGAGAVYAPAFVGSDHYQLRAGPDLEVRYKDRFYFSVIDGVGVDVIKTDSLRVGPLVKFQQKRRESGKNTFVVAGGRSDELRGLGSVSATAEAGGYVQYDVGGLSARAEVRKGIGGHDGIVADVSARFAVPIPVPAINARPVIVAVGPRATIVDDKYNASYFGIDANQSARSGLRTFNAKGGLLSYGVGSAVIIPLSDHLSGAILSGYDRISGDAAKSPLVRDRGSRNQATLGLGLSYRFGRQGK
jgi:outer membrane protein